MKPSSLVAFAALLCAAAPLPASAAPQVSTLPNGLRVVVSPEPNAGRAGLVLMVRAGDADDLPGAAGAARVLGRILTQPDNHGEREKWTAASVSGASWVATEPDVTAFSITTTPDQAAPAIRRLALMLGEPVWNRTLVMRAVQSEAAADYEEPPDNWTRDFTAWQARAGLPAPPPEGAEPPSQDALKAAFRRLYTPDRMVLAVTGEVDAADVLRVAGDAFTMPASPTARFAPRRPRPVLTEPEPPTGTYALVGVKAPPATAPDAPAVEVLAAALGLGKTSGLFQQLREREGKGYESGVVYPRRLTDSGLALYALAPGRAAAMRDDLLSVWKSAGTPPKDGWDTARARAAHAYAAQHQTARDRAYWLAFWELSGQGAAHDAAFAARLRSVPDDALAAATRRYLTAAPVSVP